ncbi:MAG: hypothetical protein LBS71_00785 [Puniceicoccales bacterium]|nr:hypothetical protein [Puniceicoccales bacterium]
MEDTVWMRIKALQEQIKTLESKGKDYGQQEAELEALNNSLSKINENSVIRKNASNAEARAKKQINITIGDLRARIDDLDDKSTIAELEAKIEALKKAPAKINEAVQIVKNANLL